MNRINIKTKTKTWIRDSYGLYDYETNAFIKNQATVEKSSIFIRGGNQVQQYDNIDKKRDDLEEELFSICEENGDCYLKKAKHADLWISLSPKIDRNKISMSLKEGDHIKLGRIILQIIQMKSLKSEKNGTIGYKSFMTTLMENCEYCPTKDLTNSITSSEDNLSNSKRTCRICFQDQSEKDNPFINPCLCAGTMKYIHLFCLQKWLSVKLNFEKNNGVISILWESLMCELCSSVFPLTVNYHNKIYYILNFNINDLNKVSPNSSMNSNSANDSNWLLIKSFSKEGHPMGLHYAEFSNLNKNEIILGRGLDCHIKINDISVSRSHAKIIFEKNTFTIYDNNSKFATLIKIDKKNLHLDESKLYFQSGRTTLEVTISRKWSNIFKCFYCTYREENGLLKKENRLKTAEENQ